MNVKRRLQRGLALLLTLCLLSGNLAFAEELPAPSSEPVVEESAQNEETLPAENEAEAPEENEENAPVEGEGEVDVSKEKVPTPVGGTGNTIYLNGKSGSDENDGTSKSQAVQSFGKAKELAEADEGIKNIIVTGTVRMEGELSLSGDRKVLRADGFDDYLFEIPTGAEASLKDIVIDGNCEGKDPGDFNFRTSLIHASKNSTLVIENGAVLCNNSISKFLELESRGGAVYATQANIKMLGGTVKNNVAVYGGGIYLSGSTLELSGGVIEGNRATTYIDTGRRPWEYFSAGGGICADQGSTIELSGKAQIRNNIANEIGGGISLGTQFQGEGNTLDMRGGTIEGNTARSGGGGVFIQCRYDSSPGSESKALISAGQIIDNRMTGDGNNDMRFGGGGIYVNGSKYGKNGELHLKNAIITGNTAEGTKQYPGDPVADTGSGGGYAACPVTKTTVYVTDGVAIYRNKAKDSGNDLYILAHKNYQQHSGEPDYDFSLRMLGGALWNWKYEGNDTVYPNDLLPLQMYKGKLEIKKEYADLPLRTDFQGSEWVNSLAKVWITGNTSATRGGGIGSNGTVIFGTEGKTTKVSVTKKWDDNNNAKKKRPESITVELVATYDDQKHVIETRELSAANGWKTVFEELPTVNAEKKITYKIKEIAVAGYKTTITDNGKDGFVITNTPETPPTPREKFIEIPLEKIWKDDGHEDKRPTEITVTLYADGVATEKTLVLSAANGWKGVFRNLPEKKDGKIITYTVKEVAVKGYESVLTGNQSDGFVLTNTYKPEKPPTPPTPPKPPIPAIPFVRIPRAGA